MRLSQACGHHISKLPKQKVLPHNFVTANLGKTKGDKTYFAVVVDDLDPFALGRNDPGADRHIEFSFGAGLDPDVVALIERN